MCLNAKTKTQDGWNLVDDPDCGPKTGFFGLVQTIKLEGANEKVVSTDFLWKGADKLWQSKASGWNEKKEISGSGSGGWEGKKGWESSGSGSGGWGKKEGSGDQQLAVWQQKKKKTFPALCFGCLHRTWMGGYCSNTKDSNNILTNNSLPYGSYNILKTYSQDCITNMEVDESEAPKKAEQRA